jgi:hypothetical protein
MIMVIYGARRRNTMPRWAGVLLMAWMVLQGGLVEARWRLSPPPAPSPPPSTRLTAIGLPEDFSSAIMAAMEETQVNTDMAKRAIVDKQLKVRSAPVVCQ